MTEHIKPPTIGGLDGFETWNRTVQAPENKEVKVAFVSVRAGGTIGLNKACYLMWGEPPACQVMYDPERRKKGMKVVARRLVVRTLAALAEMAAFKIRRQGRQRWRRWRPLTLLLLLLLKIRLI